MRVVRVTLTSSGVSLLARPDKAAEDLLARRWVDAAGEAAQGAAEVAKESVSRRTGWWCARTDGERIRQPTDKLVVHSRCRPRAGQRR